MSNNGLFPNTTQIPNVILDRWLPHLSGSELKVVMYVCRRTYGFGKEQDSISLSQMADGITKKDGTILDHGAGLSKSAAAAACKSLAEKGVLSRTLNTSQSGGAAPTGYQLNLQREPGKKAKGVAENGQGGSPKIGQGVVQRLDTQNQVRQKEEKDVSNDTSKESELSSTHKPKKLRVSDEKAEELWENLITEDENAEVLEEFAEFTASKLKTKSRTLAALWRQIGKPYLKAKEAHGSKAVAAGLQEAMRREVPDFRYAASVAKNWTPDNVTPIKQRKQSENRDIPEEAYDREAY